MPGKLVTSFLSKSPKFYFHCVNKDKGNWDFEMKIQNKELSWPNSPRPNSGSLKWIILSLSLQSLNWKRGDWLITLKLIRTFVNRGYLEQIHKTVFSVCCTGWWLPCTITTDWIGGAWPSLAHSLLLNWGGGLSLQLSLTRTIWSL